MRHYDHDARIAKHLLRTEIWLTVALLLSTVALGAFILLHPALACGR